MRRNICTFIPVYIKLRLRFHDIQFFSNHNENAIKRNYAIKVCNITIAFNYYFSISREGITISIFPIKYHIQFFHDVSGNPQESPVPSSWSPFSLLT